MKKIISIVSLLFFTVLLSGCLGQSDLIGKWESEPIMGMQGTMEFKSGAMISSSSGGIASSGTVETKVEDYVSEKTRLGVVVKDGDNKITMWFNVKDKDTIVQDLGLAKVTFHRVK